MLRLLALSCLLLLASVASAQRTLYCDASSPVTVTDRDFYLVTRPSGVASYSQGLTCEFSAAADAAFLVEVESVRVGTAVLTISSGGHVLFSGSNVPAHQSSLVTPSKSLMVRFDATGDHSSNKAGFKIRVRVLDTNGCPPGWTYLLGNCYGTSNTSMYLDYISAQAACNSMRSNLLHVPTTYLDRIRDFVRMLPQHLKSSYTWVGLTHRTSQFTHFWLSGVRQSSTSEISCMSSSSSLACYSYERCGSILYDTSHSIYMGDCTRFYRYACSMPPGGAPIYYSVPRTLASYSFNTSWIWGVVVACMLVVSFIIAGIYYGVRQSQVQRATGANSVVVSTGRVGVSTSSGGCPIQPSTQPPYPVGGSGVYPTQPQSPSPPPYPVGGSGGYPTQPQYSAAPPSYDVAVGGGYGNVNAGYAK